MVGSTAFVLMFGIIAITLSIAISNSDVENIKAKYRRDDKKTVFWMHIQKTSSWMGDLLAVWACPDFCNKIVHYMIAKRAGDGDSSSEDNNRVSKSIDSAVESDRSDSESHEDIWDGTIDYFNMIDSYFSEVMKMPTASAMMKSSIMNCSVNFDGYGSGVGWHFPLKEISMRHTVITIFREPTDRLISAFLFDVMIPIGFQSKSIEERRKVKDRVRQSQDPIYSYATLPGISSCQTKMVLGFYCGADVELSNHHIEKAKHRLRNDFYFIGLTEESVASVNLFLAMHHADGGKSFQTTPKLEDLIHPLFRFTSNRRNNAHNSTNHANLLEVLKRNRWNDTFDMELYTEARRLFYSRCVEFKIETLYGQKLNL